MCMGSGNLWFPVLSDFYPHGAVASKYGVLRSDGVSERSLFVIDKKGIGGSCRRTTEAREVMTILDCRM